MTARTILFGTAFGFILARAGATDPRLIVDMFLLRDLHIMGLIAVAIVVAALGLQLMAALGARTATGECLRVDRRAESRPGLLLGSALFGVGWALTGACPGTALAQIGLGRWTGLLTVLGCVGGAALHRRYGDAVRARLTRATG